MIEYIVIAILNKSYIFVFLYHSIVQYIAIVDNIIDKISLFKLPDKYTIAGDNPTNNTI